MQKHRIYTNIGRDQKINVEITQDFDIMEVLSLKFTQKDIFASGKCSDYGVVVGRISANNGYGIPNARISIFISQENIHEDDPIISTLYPYKDITDKDEDGYRYNLLPERQQHAGHNPTGTFFDQQDILTREEVLEVYEKYYSFTVKTNSAGDFMIWGVPIGTQILHVDIDLSDIGCFSLRPNDFLNKGYGIEQFESYFKFKSSSDIDSLPQIVTFTKSIEVYPFWGNEELCEIGITRTDFDLSEKDIKIEPVAIILFSSITDENSHAVKRNGKIRKNSGYKCNLETTQGKIECVRFTGKFVLGSDGITKYPELEYFETTETINEDGVAMIILPMNKDYVYTSELGEEVITNDPNKGIPTSATARFRFSLETTGYKVATAKYLVPNIREFTSNSTTGAALGFADKSEYQESLLTTYQFSDNFEDYIRITPPVEMNILSTNYGDDVKEHKKNLMLDGETGPQDYFYRFVYGKVYAVSSFQGTHYESLARDAYLGIKEIRPNTESDCASSTNYFPTNFAFKNRIKFNVILSQVLLFLQYLFSIVTIRFAEILGRILFNVGRLFQAIKLFYKIGQRLEDLAYRVQERYTKLLPLTIYPDCEECIGDDDALIRDNDLLIEGCRQAEVALNIWVAETQPFVFLWVTNFEATRTEDRRYSSNSAPGSTFLNNYFPGDPARETQDNCSTNEELPLTDLDGLHNLDPLEDETPRYAVEVYMSGDTRIFDSFTSYVATPSSSVQDSVYFEYLSNVYDGWPGYRIRITWDYWYYLTGMDLNISQNRTLLNGTSSDTFIPKYVAIFRIYDRSFSATLRDVDGTSVNIETGCEKYDKLYDETISYSYLWATGTTIPYDSTAPIYPNIRQPDNSYIDDPGFTEYALSTTSTVFPYLVSTTAGDGNTIRMPIEVDFEAGRLWLFKIRGIGTRYYDRKTKSGLTEFRDGLFTIIPVIRGRSKNLRVLREWYRRKRVGLSFCGGVVNYSFIDNWLHGILYFFKFDNRIRWDTEENYDLNQRGSKYPRELVFFNVLDKSFYYRSTPYTLEDGFIGQTYVTNKEILHPATFYDLGIRDEFLSEICTDIRTDPACSVVRDITQTSYQDPANVVEYAINYRLDTTNSKFDVDDFFSKRHYGSNIKVFDGDITQLISINCEAGIEAFDTDSPHYFMFNGEYMDPEDNYFEDYFKAGSIYGPTPIDFKLDNNGAYMRLCLNYRLGDYSQVVPFFLWDKRGPGFGLYGSQSDDQRWDRTQIASMPLQRIFSISGVTETRTNYLMPDGEEEYILKPMTVNHSTFSMTGNTEEMLERFEVISLSAPTSSDAEQYIEGDLWLEVLSYGSEGYLKDPWIGNIYVVVNKTWTLQPEQYVGNTSGEEIIRETFVPQTILNYWGEYNDAKQVLSTPFLFYFGLKPGRTALDLLIKYYGEKDIFTSEEIECAVSEITPTVTPTVTITPTVTVTPTVTITPTPTIIYYFRLYRCIEDSSSYYTEHPSGFLSVGTAVWGSVECDPDYAYVVVGSTTDESEYAGFTKIGGVTISEFDTCMDCEGNEITPPPPPPEYTQIYLVRNDEDPNPSTSTCGDSYYNASRIETGYIIDSPIIPYTGGYTVYQEPNTSSPHFEPSGYYWGIQYDLYDPVVHYTVYIGENGSLSDWTLCG